MKCYEILSNIIVPMAGVLCDKYAENNLLPDCIAMVKYICVIHIDFNYLGYYKTILIL